MISPGSGPQPRAGLCRGIARLDALLNGFSLQRSTCGFVWTAAFQCTGSRRPDAARALFDHARNTDCDESHERQRRSPWSSRKGSLQDGPPRGRHDQLALAIVPVMQNDPLPALRGVWHFPPLGERGKRPRRGFMSTTPLRGAPGRRRPSPQPP